ncbi:MAG TPA: hypothetical protein VFL94_03320 [Actinomycetales bacterium]|nr:hypothetical protein [Actinomycetales bacterium]
MPPVLVVARHGGYALELRRAGLMVVEPDDLAGAATPRLAACVIDAVGAQAPEPPSWRRLLPFLTGDAAPPAVAVVSYQPPPWLGALAASAVLVSAPISGRVLVQHVTTAIARSTGVVPPAVGQREAVVDVSFDQVPAVALAVEGRSAEAAARELRDPAGAQAPLTVPVPEQARRPRPDAAAHGLSAPLRMARVSEVVDRLAECLGAVPTLGAVGERLAVSVTGQLSADVAVLLGRRPDAPWSVLAGVGLRPLEWRPVRRDAPVLALLDARRPILRVESTDDVRQQAVDLPCASRRHLLVARYPTAEVLVTVGRDEPTFTAADVRTLGHLLQDERGWDDALMMCDLAESLLPYLDA